MATILDPGGTVTVVYNKSGTVIVDLAAAGTDQSTAASIPYYAGHTVAVVTPQENEFSVLLPAGADVGDVVEIYSTRIDLPGVPVRVFPQTGENINRQPNEFIEVTRINGLRCIKVSVVQWQSIKGA